MDALISFIMVGVSFLLIAGVGMLVIKILENRDSTDDDYYDY